MLDDLEARIRRLETTTLAAEDEGWPDANHLPQPLVWPECAAPEIQPSEAGDWRPTDITDH
jgi:hypothetical protein